MVWRCIIQTTVCRQNTNMNKIYVNMRASRASELRFLLLAFSHSKTTISFNILLVLHILCRYNWHNVDLCTDKFPNVPTKLRISIMGGGGGLATLYSAHAGSTLWNIIFSLRNAPNNNLRRIYTICKIFLLIRRSAQRSTY